MKKDLQNGKHSGYAMLLPALRSLYLNSLAGCLY